MNLIFREKVNRTCEFVAIAQTLIIAGIYLYYWLFAGPFDGPKVYNLAVMMAFEFIMVHSGIFMALSSPKYFLLIFVPFYGLFAWAFSAALKPGDYTILIVYLTTILNRMRYVFGLVSKQAQGKMISMSIFAGITYALLLFPIGFLSSHIPNFSLAVFNTFQGDSPDTFMSKPSTLICFGFLYYLILSFWQYKIATKESFVYRKR